jgi:hypothetical protein
MFNFYTSFLSARLLGPRGYLVSSVYVLRSLPGQEDICIYSVLQRIMIVTY